MLNYVLRIENGEDNYPEFEPLYRQHYGEMCDRMRECGVELAPYKPRLDAYFKAQRDGWLIHFTARTEDGEPVGYANIYLTNDAHNGELIAREDTIYIKPEHRKGIGRRMIKAVLEELRLRGVKRFNVLAATDPRATKLWQRMGFKPTAQAMSFTF